MLYKFFFAKFLKHGEHLLRLTLSLATNSQFYLAQDSSGAILTHDSGHVCGAILLLEFEPLFHSEVFSKLQRVFFQGCPVFNSFHLQSTVTSYLVSAEERHLHSMMIQI